MTATTGQCNRSIFYDGEALTDGYSTDLFAVSGGRMGHTLLGLFGLVRITLGTASSRGRSTAATTRRFGAVMVFRTHYLILSQCSLHPPSPLAPDRTKQKTPGGIVFPSPRKHSQNKPSSLHPSSPPFHPYLRLLHHPRPINRHNHRTRKRHHPRRRPQQQSSHLRRQRRPVISFNPGIPIPYTPLTAHAL